MLDDNKRRRWVMVWHIAHSGYTSKGTLVADRGSHAALHGWGLYHVYGTQTPACCTPPPWHIVSINSPAACHINHGNPHWTRSPTSHKQKCAISVCPE